MSLTDSFEIVREALLERCRVEAASTGEKVNDIYLRHIRAAEDKLGIHNRTATSSHQTQERHP